jgi:hypothetical protein
MNLLTVNHKTTGCAQFFVASRTFEVFGLLMVNKNLFIIEFSIAIPVIAITLHEIDSQIRGRSKLA